MDVAKKTQIRKKNQYKPKCRSKNKLKFYKKEKKKISHKLIRNDRKDKIVWPLCKNFKHKNNASNSKTGRT